MELFIPKRTMYPGTTVDDISIKITPNMLLIHFRTKYCVKSAPIL